MALRPLRLAISLLLLGSGAAAGATDLKVEVTGRAALVYDPAKDACAPIDDPDMNARAFHDAAGRVAVFALHFVNRPLRGPDVDHLKIDCRVALDSPSDPDPAHFADKYFVASTWTRDGRDVSALVHEEYHAEEHKRCTFADALACWYNAVLAFHSRDGGATFEPAKPLVVAAAPFTQDVGQGRHRGFFEPSNMFGDGRYVYVFASTTGWTGQDAGSCLFRTTDPAKPELWRAYDGSGFDVRYADPYRHATLPTPCAVIKPFTFSVGSVVHHGPTGIWLAVLQASASSEFPVDGFYYATSRDLIHWGPPRLLAAGRTLYGDLCAADGRVINYPSVLDATSPARNFDTIAGSPELFFVAMRAQHCQTTDRLLLRQPLRISVIGVGEAAVTSSKHRTEQ